MSAQLGTSGSVRRKPYRVAELAKLWDVDKSTVYRMIYSGRLHAERHGARGGALRIPVESVARYLREVAAPVIAAGVAS